MNTYKGATVNIKVVKKIVARNTGCLGSNRDNMDKINHNKSMEGSEKTPPYRIIKPQVSDKSIKPVITISFWFTI